MMEILVKYGSVARGDSDLFSDSDLLVVGKPTQEIIKSNCDYIRYTKNRLKKLKTVNSLFLVHLREEGVILKDHGYWMENFLNSIPNYSANEIEINKAKGCLSIITSIVPLSSGVQCWFDIVFVFLRDLLIKLNSVNKIYTFSSLHLLENLNIKNADKIQKVIKISREIKSNYRNGINQTVFINPIETSKILRDSFGLKHHSVNLHKTINKIDPYLSLRLVEYGLCTGSLELLDSNVLKYIKNPHRYSWNLKVINWNDKITPVEQNDEGRSGGIAAF